MLEFSSVIVQVALGILYANMVEWLVHKYVFHGRKLGKKRSGRFSHHWHEHHRAVRQTRGHDSAYKKSWWRQAISRESLELSLLSALHSPLVFIVPYFSLTISIWAFTYYAIHSKQHTDIEWAKKWTPWHWDHHMGKNQDANWCVTLPIMDHVLGTRVYYYGTPEYNKDKLKEAVRSSK